MKGTNSRDPKGKIAFCEGKAKLTFQRAKEINNRARGKEKGRSAYHCPVCRSWHLGSAFKIKRS